MALEAIRVIYPAADGFGENVVVDGVDLLIQRGESVGIWGESGSGKTSLALAAVGMLPRSARLSGRIRIDGSEAPAAADDRRWRSLRGNSVGFVFQQPSLALHPMRRCGPQIVEVLRSHRSWDRARCKRAVLDLISELDLPPEAFHAFPHQLSGGQQQRIVLAQALVCEPDVLIADEPTTGLDRETEKKVLHWVDRLRSQRGLTLLWISHDPDVLERMTDRLYVMYSGQWVEEGPTPDVLADPRHPYSAALLACRSPASPGRKLPTIPGEAPDPAVRLSGCPFRPRCRFAQESCSAPPPVVRQEDRRIWCIDPLGEPS